MQRAWSIVAGMLVTSAAHADAPAAPGAVNLLTSAPAIVAVSSTVDNAAIAPAHLVDGDLETAWNSRTAELTGAWIGARVPADAHVTAIRMTVGFTKIDPALGDLFTMNPRIRKVRVLRNGARVAEQALDPEVRTLQEIPIDQPGGQYKIEVVDIVPGTKASWREICVSELEVWGTLAPGATPTASRPVVRVGWSAPKPIAAADCVAAMFPAAKGNAIVTDDGAEVITRTEVIAVSADLAVCRIERKREQTSRDDSPEAGGSEVTTEFVTTELAPVTRAGRLVAGDRIFAPTYSRLGDVRWSAGATGWGSPNPQEYTVTMAVFPWSATENALLVEIADHQWGPHLDNTAIAATLYRPSAQGFTALLSYASSKFTDYDTQTQHEDRCQLVPPKLPAAIPQQLVLACKEIQKPWAQGARTTSSSRTQRYSWTEPSYVRQP